MPCVGFGYALRARRLPRRIVAGEDLELNVAIGFTGDLGDRRLGVLAAHPHSDRLRRQSLGPGVSTLAHARLEGLARLRPRKGTRSACSFG